MVHDMSSKIFHRAGTFEDFDDDDDDDDDNDGDDGDDDDDDDDEDIVKLILPLTFICMHLHNNQ